jgi:hypothetical protein
LAGGPRFGNGPLLGILSEALDASVLCGNMLVRLGGGISEAGLGAGGGIRLDDGRCPGGLAGGAMVDALCALLMAGKLGVGETSLSLTEGSEVSGSSNQNSGTAPSKVAALALGVPSSSSISRFSEMLEDGVICLGVVVWVLRSLVILLFVCSSLPLLAATSDFPSAFTLPDRSQGGKLVHICGARLYARNVIDAINAAILQ